MKAKVVFMVMVCFSLGAIGQTVEGFSEPAYISIKNWDHANAEVDRNIPETKEKNSNIYALIIGNEDYSSYQKSVNTESNVPFAQNDARVFKDYVVKTLGALDEQVLLMPNATATNMREGLAKLVGWIKAMEGEAEVFFYYSGHGMPHEITKKAYLMPVDVNGNNVDLGIKIDDVYDQLAAFPTKRTTIIFDACFSGGARNKGLVALKAVKINAKTGTLQGNMVVFTSSSGTQSSAVYRDKGHGFLTYYLLKSLQDSKGEVTYKECFDYIKKNVSINAVSIENKEQTPQALSSSSLGQDWFNWHFKE